MLDYNWNISGKSFPTDSVFHLANESCGLKLGSYILKTEILGLKCL